MGTAQSTSEETEWNHLLQLVKQARKHSTQGWCQLVWQRGSLCPALRTRLATHLQRQVGALAVEFHDFEQRTYWNVWQPYVNKTEILFCVCDPVTAKPIEFDPDAQAS